MVTPGGPDDRAPLSIAPDDLRQLADHDARHRTFDGGAGPLTALDTGGDGERGTVLLVPGFTGSKEDFAPLLRPLCAADPPGRAAPRGAAAPPGGARAPGARGPGPPAPPAAPATRSPSWARTSSASPG